MKPEQNLKNYLSVLQLVGGVGGVFAIVVLILQGRYTDISLIFLLAYFVYCFFSIYCGLSIKGLSKIKFSLIPTLLNQLFSLLYISANGFKLCVLGEPGFILGISNTCPQFFWRFMVSGITYELNGDPSVITIGINLIALVNLVLIYYFLFRVKEQTDSSEQ